MQQTCEFCAQYFCNEKFVINVVHHKRSGDQGVHMKTLVCIFWIIVFAITSLPVQAATWLAVQDSSGVTWARALIINDSEADSNWSLSGCRTAVASDADTAEVDPEFDWDGVVAAGTSQYVWIYGKEISEVNIANADGDASAYLGSELLDESGDGELVILVSEEGTSSVSVEASESYASPIVSGGLPQ